MLKTELSASSVLKYAVINARFPDKYSQCAREVI